MNHFYIGSGGIVVSGEDHNINDFDVFTYGGLFISGQANVKSVKHFSYNVSGGILVSSANYNYISSGSIIISGENHDINDYYVFSVGGTHLGGSAHSLFRKNYVDQMIGGLAVQGPPLHVISNYRYLVSGGLSLSGTANQESEIVVNISLRWVVFANIIVDITLGWSTGRAVLFFFRVEGECQPYSCPPIFDGSASEQKCNYFFVTNILADTPCDVCAQLSKRRFLRAIKSIKKFSAPARVSDIEIFEQNGFPQDCNTLEEIEFCQCLECAQFCQVVEDINEDNQGQNGSNNFHYIGNGRLFLKGGVTGVVKPNVIEGLTRDLSVIRTGCGCSVPSEIFLTHDFAKAAKLKDFLNRNGLVIPKIVTLSYNKNEQLWFSKLTYRGESLDSTGDERWSLIFDLKCTNSLDGIRDVWNPYYWKLGMSIRQISVSNNFAYDTKINLLFSDQGPCLKGELNVKCYLNVNSAIVESIEPPNIGLGVQLEDKIGLFKSEFWLRNPRFLIDVDVAVRSSSENTIKIGSIFPQNEISRLN